MKDFDWIKNCTAKISNAIGGGSELFTRQGDEFLLDVDFVCKRISEMRERYHDAMHRAVKAERSESAKNAEIAQLRERLEIGPHGEDSIDAAESAMGFLRHRIETLEYALKPFVTDWADEQGWTETACQKDRVVDWFGPSDFRRAASALQPTSGSAP